jgi:hypothetical protein
MMPAAFLFDSRAASGSMMLIEKKHQDNLSQQQSDET